MENIVYNIVWVFFQRENIVLDIVWVIFLTGHIVLGIVLVPKKAYCPPLLNSETVGNT